MSRSGSRHIVVFTYYTTPSTRLKSVRAGGEVIPLDGYPRFDNPYAQVRFDSLVYEIEYAGMSLMLDFEAGTREIE